jgi:hypothetical protein
MKLKLYFFILLFSVSHSVSAINRDSLKNVVQQSDVILLVKLPDTSPDSLAYFVHDLGTNFYQVPFELIKVLKNNTADSIFNQYGFVYYGYGKPGKNLYRKGETVYLFLTKRLPKEIGNKVYLEMRDDFGPWPQLLENGIFSEDEIAERQIRKIIKPSAFGKAAKKGNTKKLKRMLAKEIATIQYNDRFEKGDSLGRKFRKLKKWIISQNGIDGFTAERCVSHIAIYPGWVTCSFWTNTSEGIKEYTFSIQLATRYWRKWVDGKLKLKYCVADSGARQRYINYCIQEQINDQRDKVNNQIGIQIDEGRLNWSIVDAPQHLDSDEQTIRVKLKMINRYDSAMFVRWPRNQNDGKKVIRFVLHNNENRKSYYESKTVDFIHNTTIGIDSSLIIADGELTAWHSINDPFVENSDVTGAHHFDSLPAGKYKLEVIYEPYPDSMETYGCWKPYVDSIYAWAGYDYKLNVNEDTSSFIIKAKVVSKWDFFTNVYGQKGELNGVVDVIESSWKAGGPQAKDTIAWKILPELNDAFKYRSRPPYDHELLHVNDTIYLTLRKKQGANIVLNNGKEMQIYGTKDGIKSIERYLGKEH